MILVSGALAGFSLREWSSLLGVVGFLGLTWRALANLPELSYLARALATCLGVIMAVGAASSAQASGSNSYS